MAKKYGPDEEMEIKKVKFGKNEISNEMSMTDIEKRISQLSKETKSSR